MHRSQACYYQTTATPLYRKLKPVSIASHYTRQVRALTASRNAAERIVVERVGAARRGAARCRVEIDR